MQIRSKPRGCAEIIDRFLTFLYLPGEETLLKELESCPRVTISQSEDGNAQVRQYWDLEFSKSSASLSIKDAESELDSLLAEAVEMHMIADVPVGVLLSGGVDSTAVLSFAAEKGSNHQQLHCRIFRSRYCR